MTTNRDLNLLHALDALLHEGSVTGAARKAHLTVPAMSRALGRLRDGMGDALLVRAGRQMVLTPYAVSLRDRVRTAHAAANGVLGPASYVPLAEDDRVFNVRCSDAVASLLAGPLDARLAEAAPRLRVHFVPEGEEDAAPLRDGPVDLDIGADDIHEPELRRKVLFHDRFAFVVRRGHPLERGRLTPQRLAAAPHVAASRVGRARGPIDRALESLGLHRRIPVVVPSFLAALLGASRSDLVAAVPSTLARTSESLLPIRTLRPPFDLPAVAVSLLWHPRLDHDPSHIWLRKQIIEMSARLQKHSGR